MPIYEQVIARLTGHFRKVTIRPPCPDDLLHLKTVIPNLPTQLIAFYAQCDGIEVAIDDRVRGTILSTGSIAKKLAFFREARRCLIPLRSDGCGNYDCFVLPPGPCRNAVVFWDHEVPESPVYLLAGTFESYLEFWSEHLVAVYLPGGTMDPRYTPPSLDQWPFIGEPQTKHPWPFDEKWLCDHDPAAEDILRNPFTRAYLLHQDEPA
jgi:hypothetical protein